MARMSVDDSVLRDARITHLSQLAGWSRRETMGCLLEVWATCYDRVDHAIGPAVIDMIAGRPGFSDLMLEAELASRMPSGKLRIAGAKDRISYLTNLKQFGREGGLKSALTRRNRSKGDTKPPVEAPVKPPHNPPVPDPVPVVSPVPDPVPVLSEKNSAAPTARGSRSKKSQAEWTPSESATAIRVLSKLGARNAVTYSGSHEHVRLIVNQLRNGVSELELRAVVAYCAVELFAKPEMQKYLRPETLFGPQTIAKYLDPARTWAAREYPDEFKQAEPVQSSLLTEALADGGSR